MKKNFLVCEYENKDQYEDLIRMIKDVMSEYEVETSEYFFEKRNVNDLARKLMNLKDDFLVTIDMAGFQVSTFLGTHAYNMVSAKQIHIVLDDKKMEKYATNEMALNLYVFLDEKRGKMVSTYSHIPNLNFYPGFERDDSGRIKACSDNITVVRGMIGAVMNELNIIYGNI